ncbi:hypothetical protein KAFR_0G00340 [Kazachstania africana CBS 2517]|uniref:glucan endo-1,3-beta-D-glucosidase n=1 Tax=Kazachstania africana (strain ATCC 22294 / BCRC 22015 / CBS 2517 / CECT 1963 / NBRC 1671 / NRRL Y-8276) TaxID=1071382 RepID=H2AXG7_KAZAF|nr:hypothetical protein KAFR_0G00340 [Kazachstania africana CBS 2517]CCF59067.1 hypothetical protein KAFR_0G00340 [Kazachstania africana CBS 2517]
MQNYLVVAFSIGLAFINAAKATTSEYEMLEFTNVGFTGTFQPVSELLDIYNSSCTCEVGERVTFSGTNAPLSHYLSVHFRGPLSLKKFGYYYSDNYIIGESSSDSWTRGAYYDSESQTTSNVTFLTKAGKYSPCLAKALTYATSNGTSAADSSTVLESENYISSDEEYTIFSSVECPESGLDNDCGVYREGIPAYYGFYDTTKMFLFEFEMPTDTNNTAETVSSYDMPAIWLLNDHIPRTSQYPSNVNCSCWESGCGEFDIFEVTKSAATNELYSTFHTYQGISNIEEGIPSEGWLERTTGATMKGGVIFDSNGTTVTFLSNDTVFDSTISAVAMNAILAEFSSDEIWSTRLADVAVADVEVLTSSSASSSSASSSESTSSLVSTSATESTTTSVTTSKSSSVSSDSITASSKSSTQIVDAEERSTSSSFSTSSRISYSNSTVAATKTQDIDAEDKSETASSSSLKPSSMNDEGSLTTATVYATEVVIDTVTSCSGTAGCFPEIVSTSTTLSRTAEIAAESKIMSVTTIVDYATETEVETITSCSGVEGCSIMTLDNSSISTAVSTYTKATSNDNVASNESGTTGTESSKASVAHTGTTTETTKTVVDTATETETSSSTGTIRNGQVSAITVSQVNSTEASISTVQIMEQSSNGAQLRYKTSLLTHHLQLLFTSIVQVLIFA